MQIRSDLMFSILYGNWLLLKPWKLIVHSLNLAFFSTYRHHTQEQPPYWKASGTILPPIMMPPGYPPYLRLALTVTGLLGGFIAFPLHSLQGTPTGQRLLQLWLNQRGKTQGTGNQIRECGRTRGSNIFTLTQHLQQIHEIQSHWAYI